MEKFIRIGRSEEPSLLLFCCKNCLKMPQRELFSVVLRWVVCKNLPLRKVFEKADDEKNEKPLDSLFYL